MDRSDGREFQDPRPKLLEGPQEDHVGGVRVQDALLRAGELQESHGQLQQPSAVAGAEAARAGIQGRVLRVQHHGEGLGEGVKWR